MYCPQCATENPETASFCRGCGANIRLVPQALHGNLPAAVKQEEEEDSFAERVRGRAKRGASLEHAVKNIFKGIGFVLVAFAAAEYMPGARFWSFWLLIPAFTLIGGGLAELVRFQMKKKAELPQPAMRTAMPSAATAAAASQSALPARDTAELIPPPSITENTTRHLDAELPARHLETPVESQPKKV